MQYLELAKRNDPHFAPRASGQPGTQGDHKAEWRRHHAKALTATSAFTASGQPDRRGQRRVPEEAIVLNGFAAHFLTDAFSAGHLVNKEDAIDKAKDAWLLQTFEGVYFKESDFTRQVAAQVLADRDVEALMTGKQLKLAVWGKVIQERFSEFRGSSARSAKAASSSASSANVCLTASFTNSDTDREVSIALS